MPTPTTDTKQEQQPTLQERIVESSVKAMEKEVAGQTTNMLQSGQNPMQILTNLLEAFGQQKQTSPEDVLGQIQQLQQVQVPTGQKAGIIPSLLATGKLQRIPQTRQLGFSEAVKVLGLAQQAGASERQIPQEKATLLKSLIELSEKIAGYQTEGERIERDVTGQLTTKGIGQTQTAQVTARKKAEDAVKKEQLKSDLGVYFEIAELIPTGEGMQRFKVGVENFAQGISQRTPTGVAASRLNSLNKRLRVTLVRAAGDVGNLNIVEQKAAEELLFRLADSTQERALKKAVLQDLTRAIREKDTSKVKTLISTWMNTQEFKQKFNIGGKQAVQETQPEKKSSQGFTLDNVLEGL